MDNTENNIKEQARLLFLARGSVATSTSEIAKAANCTKAMVNYYFRSKDKLLKAILQDEISKLFHSVFSILISENSFSDKVVAIINEEFKIVSTQSQSIQFIINELNHNPDLINEVLNRSSKTDLLVNFQEDLDLETKKQKWKKKDAKSLLMMITSLVYFPFLGREIFKSMFHFNETEYFDFNQNRKKEIIDLINNYLKS